MFIRVHNHSWGISILFRSGHVFLWCNIFIGRDKTLTKALIERAEQSGFTALVLTADMPVLGNRRKMVKNKFQRPPHLK